MRQKAAANPYVLLNGPHTKPLTWTPVEGQQLKRCQKQTGKD